MTFEDGGNSLGTGLLNAANPDVATLSVPVSVFNGVCLHTITAVYGGDSNFLSSTLTPSSQKGIILYTVTTISNSGLGSLPDAVAQVDSDTSGSAITICFDTVVFATPQSIALAGSLNLNNTTPGESINIVGPAVG